MQDNNLVEGFLWLLGAYHGVFITHEVLNEQKKIQSTISIVIKKSTSLQLIKSRHGSETFLIFQIAFFRKSCHCRPYTYLLLFLNIWTLKSRFSVKVYLVFIWPFQGSDKEEEEENNEPYYDAIPDVPIETKKVPTLLRKRQQSPSKQVNNVNLSS